MLANRGKRLFLSSVLLAGVLSVAGVATAVEIGEKAPDFTLSSTTGEKISLSQFQGKKPVLIEFNSGDFFPTCMKNLSARKADYQKFQDLNVQILGIGATNPFTQKALADSLQLPFPLLSDFPDLKVIKAYDRLSPSQKYPQRAFFLVDQQGIIRGQWTAGDDEVFSNEPILKAAQENVGKPAEGDGEKKASGM